MVLDTATMSSRYVPCPPDIVVVNVPSAQIGNQKWINGRLVVSVGRGNQYRLACSESWLTRYGVRWMRETDMRKSSMVEEQRCGKKWSLCSRSFENLVARNACNIGVEGTPVYCFCFQWSIKTTQLKWAAIFPDFIFNAVNLSSSILSAKFLTMSHAIFTGEEIM
jgi:hypothetical protein